MLLHKPTIAVTVGNIMIGGGHPVVVQSMTNTDTADALRTAIQIAELHRAGSELVRITVNTEAAAMAVVAIREQLEKMGLDVPLIGDFHFNGHKLLGKYPQCASALAKYRINPGNVGLGKKRDQQFAQMIEYAIQYDKPVRIGVNWGSLDQDLLARRMDQNASLKQPKTSAQITHEALIESALSSAARAKEIGLAENRMILSCKVSHVQNLIRLYQDLSSQTKLPLHLGLTEAGMGVRGIVASTTALSVLLQQGIGDTIRISLTPQPGGSRTEEVVVAQNILQSMGLRSFTPVVIACPGCGRTLSDFFQHLAEDIQIYLRAKMPLWKKSHPGVESMTVAVMGCVVNGPGESKNANIGISLPGSGEQPVAPVYEDGRKTVTLRGNNIASEFQDMIEQYVVQHYVSQT